MKYHIYEVGSQYNDPNGKVLNYLNLNYTNYNTNEIHYNENIFHSELETIEWIENNKYFMEDRAFIIVKTV